MIAGRFQPDFMKAGMGTQRAVRAQPEADGNKDRNRSLELPQQLARAVGTLISKRGQSANGKRGDGAQQFSELARGTGTEFGIGAVAEASHFLPGVPSGGASVAAVAAAVE